MSHCIEVVCLGCGRLWCVRCGDKAAAKPSQELAERYEVALNNLIVDEQCCEGQQVVLA